MIIVHLVLFFICSIISCGNSMLLQKCSNCKHFISTTYKGNFEIGHYYGKCMKFTTVDPITNEFDYIPSVEARAKEIYCGKHGKQYEHNGKGPVRDCDLDCYI